MLLRKAVSGYLTCYRLIVLTIEQSHHGFSTKYLYQLDFNITLSFSSSWTCYFGNLDWLFAKGKRRQRRNAVSTFLRMLRDASTFCCKFRKFMAKALALVVSF